MHSPDSRPDFMHRQRHNPSYFDVTSQLGEVIDYCVPANPYFPSQEMYDGLLKKLPNLLKYYPDHGPQSVSMLSEITGLDSANLLVANGSTEVITYLVNSRMPDPMLVEIPTFGRWIDLPIDIGKTMVTYQRQIDQDFYLDPDDFVSFAKEKRVKSVVLCNPNNPTGSLSRSTELQFMIERLSHLDLIVVDESFMPFADDPSADSLETKAPQMSNVVVVKSLGKALGWHGVRLGYVVANQQLIERLRPHVPYWNINGIAQFALSLVRDYPAAFAASLSRVVEDRRYLEKRLRELPQINVFSSQANFAFMQIPNECDGQRLRDLLIKNHKLFVRECGNKIGSSSRYFRIAARPKEDTDRLVAALREELKSPLD